MSKRVVTILGMGPSANERRHDIERYTEGSEIWGLNNGYVMFPQLKGKWSRFFELHDYDYLKTWEPGEGVRCHFSTLDWLGCPIWVREPLPKIKQQTKFDTLKYCIHFDTNYFLGSPSLMLMLALYEHDHGEPIHRIQSWGIDTRDPQHAQQRTSWAYWLRAAGDRRIDFGGTRQQFMGEADLDKGFGAFRHTEIGPAMNEHDLKIGKLRKDKDGKLV